MQPPRTDTDTHKHTKTHLCHDLLDLVQCHHTLQRSQAEPTLLKRPVARGVHPVPRLHAVTRRAAAGQAARCCCC